MNIYKPRINLQKHGRLLVHEKPYPPHIVSAYICQRVHRFIKP